jgi:hypothetical protein
MELTILAQQETIGLECRTVAFVDEQGVQSRGLLGSSKLQKSLDEVLSCGLRRVRRDE